MIEDAVDHTGLVSLEGRTYDFATRPLALPFRRENDRLDDLLTRARGNGEPHRRRRGAGGHCVVNVRLDQALQKAELFAATRKRS